MKSIEIIKKNINVSRVVKQLKKNPQDWDHQKKIKNSRAPQRNDFIMTGIVRGRGARIFYLGFKVYVIFYSTVFKHYK